jgi:hypothetical protein
MNYCFPLTIASLEKEVGPTVPQLGSRARYSGLVNKIRIVVDEIGDSRPFTPGANAKPLKGVNFLGLFCIGHWILPC